MSLFGISDLVGTWMQNESNENMTKWQLQQQAQENQKNRDWQTQQAEINRLFQVGQTKDSQNYQTAERLASQRYQTDQWQNQFNKELAHRFDVPAGVNPAVYFSSHGAAAGAGSPVSAPQGHSPAPASGSMVGSVAGLSPVPFQAQRWDVPAFMQGLASLTKAKAESKKLGVETDILNRSIDDTLRKIKSDADAQEKLNALNDMHIVFQQARVPYAVKMAEAEYQDMLAKIDLTKQEKLTLGEEAALKIATSKMNKALEDYYKKQGSELDIRLRYLPNLVQSEILRNRGAASADYASAKESATRSSAINAEIFLTRLRNGIIAKDGIQLFESSVLDQLDSQGLLNRLNKSKVNLFKELCRKFENENDWYVANQILNQIHSFVQDFGDLKAIKIKQDQNDIQREDLKGKYGDTYEDSYNKYDEQGRKHTIKTRYNRSGQKYKGKY